MEMAILDLKKEARELISDHKLQHDLVGLCEENALLYDSFFEANDSIQTPTELCLENAILRKLLLEKIIQTKSENDLRLNSVNKKLGRREKKKAFQLF